MSFYNPNIQRAFDEDKIEFVQLKGQIFAEYKIIYLANEDCNVMDLSSLQFLRFENKHQQSNLLFVDKVFPAILAEIALEAFAGRVHSFAESISSKESLETADNEYDLLYFANKINQFLELIAYSDIASKHRSFGITNFNRIYCMRHSSNESEHYTLYSRLKLYEYLKREMSLEATLEKKAENGFEATLCLKLSL